MKNKYVIFDLDDTLMYEIDFLKSAYLEIAEKLDKDNHLKLYNDMISWYHSKMNVFAELVQKYPLETIENLLINYRNHFPKIGLNIGALESLELCREKGYKIGLITDGRSFTQRNKLKALEIEEIFDKIVISEEIESTKPSIKNFEIFVEDNISDYFYIADNPLKDFVTPNKLGWKSICLLNNGNNIHSQNFEIGKEFLPQIKIEKLSDLKGILI